MPDTRLILGDALAVLPTLSGIDAVVTDPPYGISLGSGKEKRRSSKYIPAKVAYRSYEDTYENFVSEILPRLNMALDMAKRAAVFTGPHLQEQRKASAIGGVYGPSSSSRHCWGFKDFFPVLFYGKAPAQNIRGCLPTVLRTSGTAEKNGHPCPKPLNWMRWLVERATLPGETVLDPFMGSGTTGVACLQTGRNFIGIEIDPEYFAIAQKRLAEVKDESPLYAKV